MEERNASKIDRILQDAASRSKRMKAALEPRKLSVTIRQATQATGLSQRKIYTLIEEGRLASRKIDKRRLIIWDSLEQLIFGK
jgi:hypothetical protein